MLFILTSFLEAKMRLLSLSLSISICSYFFFSLFFNVPQSALLASVLFLVIVWTNEALPMGVVSLLPVILFPSFGILDVNSVSSEYANPIIFLFLGGFMLSIAFEKTKLHAIVAKKIMHIFPSTVIGIVYALTVTSALLSSMLSNTTVALMLLPVALSLSSKKELKAVFLLAIAYGASIGGTLTPIGTPPNLILFGFLEEQGEEFLTFAEWVFKLLPLVLVMLVMTPWIIARGVDKKFHIEIDDSTPIVFNNTHKRLSQVLAVLIIILALNAFSKQMFDVALDEKMLLLGFGLLMFIPKIGFLKWSDTKKIPYEIIFLFGAGFSIAAAFMHTGLAAQFATLLLGFSALSFFILLVVVALLVVFLTEATSNTALISMMVPILFEFTRLLDPHEAIVVLMVATVSGSFAFMLPIATPPNAIVISSGDIKIKQMIRTGFIVNIFGITAIATIGYFFW
jgi:sodium-dependent dicarboxylate transporter 2/3/5